VQPHRQASSHPISEASSNLPTFHFNRLYHQPPLKFHSILQQKPNSLNSQHESSPQSHPPVQPLKHPPSHKLKQAFTSIKFKIQIEVFNYDVNHYRRFNYTLSMHRAIQSSKHKLLSLNSFRKLIKYLCEMDFMISPCKQRMRKSIQKAFTRWEASSLSHTFFSFAVFFL
jgi:hypothetical protein